MKAELVNGEKTYVGIAFQNTVKSFCSKVIDKMRLCFSAANAFFCE